MLLNQNSLLVSDPRKDRVDELHMQYGVQSFVENVDAACQADVVVLSIKPQALDKVLE